ncbi:flagellar hook protein FlgE [Salinicola peritrichatus]|uniref:flagellar hook protein FlgE n=1 Tax=Salinicola peritrichatus TaxID=1267424 RepID=UPI000DA23F0E|nr:flagellar hook protein FlgE [Salinicola peritrichatus]
MGFSQALSGVNAASQQLDTIGNNISNSQTKGFKSSSVQFADVYAGSQIGLGTRVSGVLQDFTNGTLETTNRDLDLGISGDGFLRFVQGDQVGYSRNGQLTMTADGYLANAQGAYLTGYNVSNFNSTDTTATVPTGGLPEIIQLPSDSMIAKATQNASAAIDLDSSDAVPTRAFDPSNSATYNYGTSSSVIDSQGNAYDLQMFFIRADEAADGSELSNAWTVETRVALGENNTFPKTIDSLDGVTDPNFGGADPASVTGGNGEYTVTSGGVNYIATVSGATPTTDAAGNVTGYTGGSISYSAVLDSKMLQFDNNGQLSGISTDGGLEFDNTTTATSYAFDPQNGAAPLSFDFDFAGSSQTAQDYATNSPQQDGYTSGQLVGVSIDEDGTIIGSYSNNQNIGLGRVVLADFSNPEGLESLGDNLWAETSASGQAVMGTAGSGRYGSLQSGTLEASNVDLTEELVNLIIAQRNFQANTNTIKTQDEVMQTVVNLR